MTSICFINPLADFPTYFAAENYRALGLRPATQMADLTIPTLAAMAPPGFDVALCDENVSPPDYAVDTDFVAITGKITQLARMIAMAKTYRERGKRVLIGGPLASLSPELLRPHCDILVRGEIEEIAADIFGDLASGTFRDEYVGSKPTLERSPVPRWDLYPNDRSLMGTLQTSRGCPFECEFCDVIQYAGRKQRHKEPAQVLAELDVLYRHGYRTVFLADDNFTVYRARARELLLALRSWNARQTLGRVSFLTQLSVDVARDDELLELCADAGLASVFIGLETPNEDSLRETKKRQNLRRNLVEEVQNFLSHGISVIGGMIVGFDSDGPDIFERQYNFAMASGVPIFSLGALVAPAATPLYARLRNAGRLKTSGGSEVAAMPWATNIVHPRLSEAELLTGLRWLGNNLYSPAALGQRLLCFIEKFQGRPGVPSGQLARPRQRSVDVDKMIVLSKVRELGPAEELMWARVTKALANKPAATNFVMTALVQYMQIRYMYRLGHFWEAQLAGAPPPGMGELSPAGVHRSLPVVA